MYRKIIVATDGSLLAEKAIDCAIKLAKQLNSELYVVTVTNPVPYCGSLIGAEWVPTPSLIEDYNNEMTSTVSKILDKAKEKAKEANIESINIHVENQLASHGIIDAAKQYDVDLIVIASHGRRGFKRLILGSQAAEVLSLSEIPVLIVK